MVTLEVLNWAFSLGGEHFTGKLVAGSWCKYERKELKHPLTAAQAKSLNKKGQARGFGLGYRRGQMSEQFFTREEIEDYAIRHYRDYFPEADILLVGTGASCSAQRCLDAPSELKAEINKLHEKREKAYGTGRFGEYPKGAQQADKAFEKLVWEDIEPEQPAPASVAVRQRRQKRTGR